MRLLLLFCCIGFSAVAFSQNLVCNGGFEEENICTEYQKNCAPEAWIATSLWSNYYFDQPLQKGALPPYEGTHFVGLTAGNLRTAGMRNFLRTRLLCGMRKGHQYQLEFFVFAIANILDSIGVYFSPDDFLYEKRNFKQLTPQLWSTDGMEKPVTDPRKWQRIRFTYTATGEEGYITIGNFKKYDYAGIRQSEFRDDYYFFVDGVSLTPVDENEKLCAEADSVRNTIYRENERHNYLDRRVYYYRKNPPKPLALPVTRMPVVKKVQHIDTLIIPDIFFATASYELSPKSYHLLDSFATALGKHTIDSIVMEGHTDSIGKLAYNNELSVNRALSVKEYVSQKVPAILNAVVTRGFAYLRPVASNKTPQGRQQNRRVEIFVYRKE